MATIVACLVAVVILLVVAAVADSPVSTSILAFVAIGSAFVAIAFSRRRGRA